MGINYICRHISTSGDGSTAPQWHLAFPRARSIKKPDCLVFADVKEPIDKNEQQKRNDLLYTGAAFHYKSFTSTSK